MKKKLNLFLLATVLIFLSCKKESESKNTIIVHPINHATFVLEYNNEVVYVDPVGGKPAFENQKKPTLVLITDIHGDHFDNKTLLSLDLNKTPIIVPNAVEEILDSRLKENAIVLKNNQSHTINGALSVEAIPMYNLREEAIKFHPKGRGNGYVLTIIDKRIYISGDTEDIKEMRALKNIDMAFVCMNLPYTMTVESAADAVLDFSPKKVYPYHYRGNDGKSDVKKFKSIVEKENENIKVIQLNWY